MNILRPALAVLLVCMLTLSAHPGHPGPHDEKPAQPAIVALVFSDFQCRPCAEVSGLIEELATARKLTMDVLFKHAPGKPGALLAHEAALAAGAQGKFWEMHDLLFAKPDATHSEILAMAGALQLDVPRFRTAIEEREHRDLVMKDMAEARGLGVHLTPTLFLNGTRLEGIEQIRAFVGNVLTPPDDGMDSDKTYVLNTDGSPSHGSSDAPITLVEFSDFRCGFCGAHGRTVTDLVAAYPGKIRRVFKHFPIQVDAAGKLPHQGAMAAMAQGRFWEMYAVLMEKPLTGYDDLLVRAADLGLDMDRFLRDLASESTLAMVQRDIDEGDRLGIRMTPTTFINGKIHSGRLSPEALRETIEALLDPNRAGTPALTAADNALGPEDAVAVIEFFADLTDPQCAQTAALLREFHGQKPNARIVFHHYPSRDDAVARQAHRAILSAGEQGQFWPMADLIFAAESPPDGGTLLQFATRLKLNLARFQKTLGEARIARALDDDIARGDKRGLKGTPALYLNGKLHQAAVPTMAELVKLLGGDACCDKRRGSEPDSSTDGVDIFAPDSTP